MYRNEGVEAVSAIRIHFGCSCCSQFICNNIEVLRKNCKHAWHGLSAKCGGGGCCKCAGSRSTPGAWLAACIFGDVFEEEIYNGCMMRRGW